MRKYAHPSTDQILHGVWVPDRTTRSFTFSPLCWKSFFNVLMLAFGGTRFSKASVMFEILPSLRPVSTSQDGPLIWDDNKIHLIKFYVKKR